LARPERFELLTPWFAGRIEVIETFVNQLLAALAVHESSLSQSHLSHNQSGKVAISATASYGEANPIADNETLEG